MATPRKPHLRLIKQLRRQAQIESWAHRFAVHRVRYGWQQHAACRGTDTLAWFDDDKNKRADLLPICASCPVRLDCGTEAMQQEERHTMMVHGVRAGFGPHERHQAGRIYDRLTQSV